MTMHLLQSDLATAFLAHLLQSTAFAAAAWLLTLALGRYPARVRFWIWMSASIKFLVPFAPLTSLGTRWARPQAQAAHSAFYTVIEEFSQPFAKAEPAFSARALSAQSLHTHSWIPWSVAAIWLCGCLVVLGRWAQQWISASRMMRDAQPSLDGPEEMAVRNAESQARMRSAIPVLLTSRAVEPGIFGVVHPVLLWPARLSKRLDDAQIQAIVAHELEHVRRRDNLLSAIHTLVEALFWFHPALYWIGSKMRDERERACDESVIERNAPPEQYAESILKVCAFCLEAPLPCIAGVSGSDLKKRVLRIMNNGAGTPLTLGRRVLLAAVALSAIALPVGLGVVHGQTATASNAADSPSRDLPKFDVASIKPGKSGPGPSFLRFNPDGTSAHNMPLQFLLRQAFGVEDDRIVGAPPWVKSNRYDIEAKVMPEDAPKLDKLKAEDRGAMLIPVLVERFNLKYHHESRELPMYALVVAKSGAKLKSAAPDDRSDFANPPFDGTRPKGLDTRGRMMFNPGRIEAQDTTIDMLAHVLAQQLGRSVIDKTGLTSRYDYTLQWTPDNTPTPAPGGPDPAHDAVDSDAASVSLFTAIQEQLGLKLESEKSTVDVIVIDHIELPSAN